MLCFLCTSLLSPFSFLSVCHTNMKNVYFLGFDQVVCGICVMLRMSIPSKRGYLVKYTAQPRHSNDKNKTFFVFLLCLCVRVCVVGAFFFGCCRCTYIFVCMCLMCVGTKNQRRKKFIAPSSFMVSLDGEWIQHFYTIFYSVPTTRIILLFLCRIYRFYMRTCIRDV